MTRRNPIWLFLATLFVAANAYFVVWAAVRDEIPHAAAHLVLAVLGAALVRWLAARRRAAAAPVDDRLGRLEQSVDAVALEVERIGEGQRFVTRLVAERQDAPPVER